MGWLFAECVPSTLRPAVTERWSIWRRPARAVGRAATLHFFDWAAGTTATPIAQCHYEISDRSLQRDLGQSVGAVDVVFEHR